LRFLRRRATPADVYCQPQSLTQPRLRYDCQPHRHLLPHQCYHPLLKVLWVPRTVVPQPENIPSKTATDKVQATLPKWNGVLHPFRVPVNESDVRALASVVLTWLRKPSLRSQSAGRGDQSGPQATAQRSAKATRPTEEAASGWAASGE
jgi:hypothetical protein